MNSHKTEDIKEKLIDNAKDSLSDAEELLRRSRQHHRRRRQPSCASARWRSIRRTREALYDAQDALIQRGRRAARATDDYVHDNPWQAISIAGVAGLLLGMLISRR